MQELLRTISANKAVIAGATLLLLKWIYNAWTDGVTFPQFVRAFIGEIIQEAPNKLPGLTPDQVKLLAKAQAERPIVAAPETKTT